MRLTHRNMSAPTPGDCVGAATTAAPFSYREVLEAKRAELRKRMRLDGIEIERTADAMDAILGNTSRAQAAVELRVTRATLKAVDMALIRLERGEFGFCVVCENAIPRKRLEVIAWTECCVRCAEDEERIRAERFVAEVEAGEV